MEYVLFILLSIVILLVMIVIHEAGHYTAGKILKFKINEFAVGFGPKIFSKTNKKTGEVFSLRAIPLGGYCAFEDEEGTSETKSDKSFVAEKPWKRIIVLVSGALFNFISAFIFAFIFILVVGYAVPKVGAITLDGGIAYNPNIQTGDIILEVDGTPISVMDKFDDLASNISEGETVTLTVERDGKIVDVAVTKQLIKDSENGDYVGFGFKSEQIYIGNNFVNAIKYFVPLTFKLSWLILGSFGQLITGQVKLSELSGPIGTIDYMAQASVMNWRNIFLLLPLIASNLAIFNLLPIPALDGSKVVFTVIEWIRKKPINRNIESIIHVVGFFVLIGFVVLVDLLHFIT